MPIYGLTEGDCFDVHGSRFTSFLRTARGASSLCAWRLDVPPDLPGVAHRPSREEVMLLLDGELRVTIDGLSQVVGTGGVVHVPAGAELTIDGGPRGAAAWVTTTSGLQALIGTQTITPPWAQ